MNESLLNRLLRDRKRQRRMLGLILCLSMLVSLATFAGFHKNAIAKVYTREVLDCPYAHEGAAPVAHTHNDDCYEGDLLVCTLPEREAHMHADACYAELQVLRCGLEESEGHQHTGECFDEDGTLTCGMEAGEGAHVHSEACFENEYALICDQPELPTHVHGPECFRTEEITVDEPEEVIEPETPAQPEQTIPEMPVSDPNADLETADDWNREFENLELSGNWARDLVLVAATQQGRGESPNNYEAVLNDTGDAWVKHGYTRYGAWYGVPYADEWSAMFVSFCLRYAGIPAENVPNNPTAAFMAESFSMGELFAGRDYVPAAGDLIFFGTVDDDIVTIDHMGIVYHVDPENSTINTVEGDRTDAVATFGYYLDDEQIVGYGILPQNPNLVPGEEENVDEEFGGFIFMTTDEEEKGEEKKETVTVEDTETTDTEDVIVPALFMPAQSWERTAGGIKVTVEAPEGAFPESTRIAVTPVNGSSLMDTVSEAVDGAILEVQAVDITFFDAEGREIEPAIPIRVVMTPAATEHAEEKTNVVHIDLAQQTAEVIEQAEGTETDNSEVVFDAEAFTIYAIVYTVHFEYEVNGQVYTSTVPGAQDKLLSELIRELNVVNEEQLPEFMTKIREVSFSNPEVLKITETEGDWIIRALKDSDQEEGLTIVMQDGATFRITVEAEGITEVSDENEVATVSTVNDLYLPASSEVKAELLTEEQSGNAIAAVQSAESSSYQTFSIALENVDVTAYDGFNVAVTLPEDAVIGRDFQLYQVKEDGSSTDLTESLTVTGETNEDGLQNVSGISFTTEDFADFVLGYSIETFYTTAAGDTYRITLNYGPKAGIPDGADLKVKEILPEDESYTNYLNESAAKLGVPCNAVSFARFFDIEIRKDDEKIEPKAPVQVTISLTDAPEENVPEDLKVLHFAQTGLETIDGAQAEQKEDATIDLIFETDGFSVYGVVYTVDFHYEINGKVYDFSIPGGGFISLEHLIEVLGINAGDADSKDSATGKAAAEENYEGSLETVTASAEGIAEAEIEAEAGSEDDSVAAPTTSNYEQAINLNSVPVSEETRAFVENIETVEFSSPELVWVGKTETESTVGALKEANGLEIEYSANLTEEQIAEINTQTVEAGDWALISIKPFDTEETLTVTMKNGDVFTIRVTDAQISANVLTADGVTFRITVTFDDTAEIPEGTVLEAEEIEYGSDEYLQYLGRTWSEVNRAFSESADRSEDARYVNVNAARFFDIKLLYQGEEIEPLAPVQVEITYTDGLPSWANTKPGVVHFKPDEIEVLEEVQTEVAGEVAVSFHYELDSFSVIGTYIQQETHDVETPPYGAYSYSPNAPVFAASADYAVPEASEGNGVLTIPPVALRANGEGEAPSTADDSGLPLPNGNKSLDPNGDGTYTLTLSVKGSSQTTIQKVQKKANVLFVMDRSSSMITNTVSDDESFWYYGTLATAQLRGDISPANGYQFYGVINGNYVELNASSTWTSWYNYSLTYNRWNGNTWVTENYPDTSPIYVKSHTTRLYAEQAALEDVIGRLLAYNTAETPDEIEVAVISFADHRSDSKGWTETEHGWVQGTDRTSLMDAINSTKFASGTNWEEALQYAYSVINAKKTAEADKPEEDYYVVFLTDGEPTNMVGDTSAAQHTGDDGNLVAYDAAKDDALELVSNGFKFYNIFTYRIDESEKYSKYLTNYAYGQGDYNENETEALNTYFSDAQTVDALNNTFNNIFLTIANVIGHANVSITDTMTTDAMTTTVVQGKTNGYVYTVKDPSGTVLYTVRATGDIDNPTVTFNVPSSATKNYTATETDVDEKKLYSITTAEGQKYGIALADVNNTTGELTWDLSPVGILMDDCTYSVSFVVWPDQNAYDYVAGLNNGLSGFTWNEEAAVDSGKGYKSGGVSQYPSIVKYPDGTYAVLTNTDQKIHYSVVEMETINGEPNGDPEVHGPYYSDLQTPNPMPLEASESSLEKKWNVERDPGILAQLLYNLDGSSSEFSIEYDIMRGDEEEPYVSINLGWDAGKGEYVWEPGSVRNVTYNGHTVQVGTRWAEDFAIATGLMLSEEHMDARGLDKSAYPSGIWNGVTYYVLETGHDYTIIEKIDEESASKVGYEFDFVSPVYHPMLVDGVLRSVNYTKTGDSITITSMTDATVDLQSLQVQNTLRGYINLEKVVLGKDGRTPVPEDDTKFEYRVELRNATDPGPFTVEGDHVPWYGISGLFYHDAEYNYYQAYPTAEETITLTDEHGNTFIATSTDFEESVGPATLSYTDNGVEKTLVLYGNQMEHNSDNYVSATIKISQGEVLNIANVPAGTTYTITETLVNGYDLVSILREIRNGTVAESSELSTGSPVAAGTIVADRDNHIIYTNKIHSVDLTVKKVDGNNEVLTGAVFTLTKEAGGDETGTVYTRPDGDETDTGTYMFSDLQDGSYTLSETPPPGYTGIADLTFTVTDGAIAEMSNLPDGATWDGSNLTLTVVNTPTPGVLTVRKQWQDFFGNPISYTGTLDLKLVQYIENTSANYNVTVTFRYVGDNGKPFATKTGTGVGPATIQWQWNSNTTYPGVHNITVTGLNNGEYSVTSGNNYWFTLSIPNVNRDMTITVNVYNYNYNPYHYDGSNITDVNITEAVVTEGYQATGGVRTISLGGNGNWTEAFTMSGDGILQDNNDSTIPITYNGKTCYYLIEEESVPDGFTLHQISGDVVQSGVLTAYNRKTSVDVQVEKVDKTNASTKLNGATFTLRQIDPTKTGNIGTRSLDGGKTDTRTTANGGKLSFTDLGFGYYEIKETVAPDGYIIGPAKAFYIKIDDSGVQLLQMDESVPAEQWGSISSNAMVTTIQNASVTVVNEPGVALPQTGGIGTTLFTTLGGFMTASAGAVLTLASHRRKRKPAEG